MAKKGGIYERELAVRLSIWWSQDFPEGPRQDIFWRSTQSGGRATTRMKKGKKTSGSYGDLAAIDPLGQPLLELFTIEIKRGYSKDTIHDLLDLPAKRQKNSTYGKWFTKVQRDAKAAGSISWLLITRRDQRRALAFVPVATFNSIARLQVPPVDLTDLTLLQFEEYHPVYCFPLENFLGGISPASIRQYLRTKR